MPIKKYINFSFEMELQNCTDGKVTYTRDMNILMNDRSKDWYSKLGKYIFDTLKDNYPTYAKQVIDYHINKGDKMNDDSYRSLAIFFMTSDLGWKSGHKLWGPPLYHDEFGEGFYDDDIRIMKELDNDEKSLLKMSNYASYFITVDGIKMHIGYDHRGTGVEFEQGTTPQQAFDCLKEIVDDFKNI